MQPRGSLGPRKRPEPHRKPAEPLFSADERLGRFLSFVLRHHPEKLGISLDEQASVDLETLVRALKRRPGFADLTRKKVEAFAASAVAAHRFEITGNRIRACYGHNLPNAVKYPPAQPPESLFFGTTAEMAQLIEKQGLKSTRKRRVHLSANQASAKVVGLRQTPQPTILRIDTALAAKAGVQFYNGGPLVWLSDDIPAHCLSKAE